MNRFGFESGAEHDAWLGLVTEEAIDPGLPIIDAHHHFFVGERGGYGVNEYCHDLDSGHNIVASVFAECHAMYREYGPEELRCVGESEFVSAVANRSDAGEFGARRVCGAMVGSADMTLGDAVEPVLDAHAEASLGRFRGVRISCPWHAAEGLARYVDSPDYLARADIRRAMAVLQARSLSLDIWVYHTQLADVVDVARAFPDLVIVLNHYGAPVLGGPYRGKEQEVFDDWRASIRAVAACPNVVLKTGAMVIRKSDRANPDLPPTSMEIQRAWQPWTDVVFDCFGPERCMFESNFPVHKNWVSFPVLCNAFKRMTAGLSDAERIAFFSGTAVQTYGLQEC